MPELAARPHHRLRRLRDAWDLLVGKLRRDSLDSSSALPARFRGGPLRLAGRNTTRPGGMAFSRTRAGLYELPAGMRQTLFLPAQPGAGRTVARWVDEVFCNDKRSFQTLLGPFTSPPASWPDS